MYISLSVTIPVSECTSVCLSLYQCQNVQCVSYYASVRMYIDVSVTMPVSECTSVCLSLYQCQNVQCVSYYVSECTITWFSVRFIHYCHMLCLGISVTNGKAENVIDCKSFIQHPLHIITKDYVGLYSSPQLYSSSSACHHCLS